MSINKLTIRITTRSNLFIGGSPVSFEIGGVDLQTVINKYKKPYIPASSFKGALRNVVRDLTKDTADSNDELLIKIKKCYVDYLKSLKEEADKQSQLYGIEEERTQRMLTRYQTAIDQASAEYLFGMEGFNDTPKLIFNDFVLEDDSIGLDDLFSLDYKNTISTYEADSILDISAKPRVYQVVRPNVTFIGDIIFQQAEKLSKITQQEILFFVEQAIAQFNTGIYRLGNSGSRGYGKVHIDILEEVNA